MSAFVIRLLAVGLMVVDHIGAFLWWDNFGLRIIGRLSFPLFAWLIANGYVHTSDKKKYLKRLIVFAFISQVPYFLIFDVFGMGFMGLNIFFTLSLGMAAIWLFDKNFKNSSIWSDKILGGLGVAGLCLFGEVVRADYGWRGVALVLAMYVGYRSKSILILIAGPVLAWPVIYQTISILMGWRINISEIEMFGVVGLAALPIIFTYNHKAGYRRFKYLFYVFYPAHLFVLYLLVRIVYRL